MAGALATLRQEGAERFEALGYPSRRSEMWKYTDVRAIAGGEFSVPVPSDLSAEQAALIESQAAAGAVIIIQNGALQADLATNLKAVQGIRVRLASEDEAATAAVLGGTPAGGERPFAHLNAAHMADPVLITIDPGAVIEKPIHLTFLNSGNGALHGRVFIEVGDNAQATILETHHGAGGDCYFANPVSHIRIGAGARLRHYRKQLEGPSAFHIASVLVGIGRDATYDSFALSLGAELARHEIETVFHGPGGDCIISGAYLAAADQHLDTTTRIEHVHPDCRSREVYHGVIAEKGRGVFQGSIYVHPEAQRTDGHQLNRTILLGKGAEIDAKPQLEIYADDVKCSHGCTAGRLDEQALFYMRSRGISENDAKALLINGFLAEAMLEIKDPDIQADFLGLAQAAMDRQQNA